MSRELRASDVVVTNARSVHGPVVAEHAIVLMFAMAKRLPAAMRYQQQHVWGQEPIAYEEPHPTELSGSTVGIIGFGSIGGAVADRARALGMRVLRQHPGKNALPSQANAPNVIETFGSDRLDEVISQSDFVVLAAPLTDETRNLVDGRRLALMRPTAYIINVARGPLIEEAALIRALRERRIGGAALDVFDREPLPADSPLWDLDNLLITPHTAALTDRMWERHYVLIRENLRRYLAGEPLLGLVDKRAGY
jgi:phosphoglycerate dehydrogenase-like enzyme